MMKQLSQLTYNDIMLSEVWEDENLNGRARLVYAFEDGQPLYLPGFSANPNQGNATIRMDAYSYYTKLRKVLHRQKTQHSF